MCVEFLMQASRLEELLASVQESILSLTLDRVSPSIVIVLDVGRSCLVIVAAAWDMPRHLVSMVVFVISVRIIVMSSRA